MAATQAFHLRQRWPSSAELRQSPVSHLRPNVQLPQSFSWNFALHTSAADEYAAMNCSSEFIAARRGRSAGCSSTSLAFESQHPGQGKVHVHSVMPDGLFKACVLPLPPRFSCVRHCRITSQVEEHLAEHTMPARMLAFQLSGKVILSYDARKVRATVLVVPVPNTDEH